MSSSAMGAASTETMFGNLTTEVTTQNDRPKPRALYDIALDYLLIFTLVLALYLLIVLCYHEWYLHQSDASKVSTIPKRSKLWDIATWLRILCILSALFSLFVCINDIVYYNTMATSDIHCTMVKNLGVSWLIEVDTTVYLFLWVRQRVLYQKRSMVTLNNFIVTFLSWLSLGLVVAIFVVMNTLLGWRTYTYDAKEGKCIGDPNPVRPVFHKLFLGSSTVLHILLVSLYVYPLLRQSWRIRQRRRSSAIPSPNRNAQDVANRKKKASISSSGRNSLMNIVIRCVIISLLCVITDGITIVISREVFGDYSKARHLFYNLNVLFNSVAIVGSFKNWKFMLFPCTEHPKIADPARRESQSTSVAYSASVAYHAKMNADSHSGN